MWRSNTLVFTGQTLLTETVAYLQPPLLVQASSSSSPGQGSNKCKAMDKTLLVGGKSRVFVREVGWGREGGERREGRRGQTQQMFNCGRSVSVVVGCEAERSHCDLHPAFLFLLSHSPPPPFSFDFLYSSAILRSSPHPVMFVSPLFTFCFLSSFSFSSLISSSFSPLISHIPFPPSFFRFLTISRFLLLLSFLFHLRFLVFFSCLFFSRSSLNSPSFFSPLLSFLLSPVFSFPSATLPRSPFIFFIFLGFSFSSFSSRHFSIPQLPILTLLIFPKSSPRLPLSSSFLPFFSSSSFTFLFLFSTLFSSSCLPLFLIFLLPPPLSLLQSPIPLLLFLLYSNFLSSSSSALPFPPLLPRDFHFHFFLLIFSTRRFLSLLKSSPCLLFSPPLCTNVPFFLSFLLPLPLSDLSLVAAEIRSLHVFPNLIWGGKKILRCCWKQLHVIIFLGCTWIKNILFIGSGPERWRICDQSSLNWVTEDLSYFGLRLGKWFVLR